MHDPRSQQSLREITRRHFFRQSGFGIGGAALASLFGAPPTASAEDVADASGAVRIGPHFQPRAKRIIYLFMAGAPSQLDMFDPKPKLTQFNGQVIPEDVIKGERFAFIKNKPTLLASPFKFARHGQSGGQVSELLPHLAKHVDDLAIIRSMKTSQFNHSPAQIFMNTGFQVIGRPSLGAWMSYGLGTENADLPAFVVLLSGERNPDGGTSCWGSGFLPTEHQGVQFRSGGEPVLFVENPKGMPATARRDSLDTLRELNTLHYDAIGDPEIQTRIGAYELAYRMQTSVPELTNIATEPASIHELYGTTPGQASFANNCLLARRLVQRGVRFVQLYHRGWDTHGNGAGNDIVQRLPRLCQETDRPIAALLTDLKRLGLLDDTLVVWGGEFGRTPMNEAREGSKFFGRDHHARAFTMWMAGGGVRRGLTYGATDDLGYNITEHPVDVHDLHATVLHLMGFDHTRLTYPFQGRDYRLTDVSGQVVRALLA